MFEGRRLAIADLVALIPGLAGMPDAADDGERIDRIRALEELKGAVAAAQARETAMFAASRRAHHAARRTRPEHVERDIAGQVGLARRISPQAARRYVGFANIVTTELPETYAVLQRGGTSEWRAVLVARNTMFVSRDHRAEIDRAVAAELPRLGDRRVDTETRKHAYRLDPRGAVERARNAEKDRRVGVRPAPETMVWFRALLPVAPGVACYAALGKAADAQRAAGDGRSRGQLMADLMVERILGCPGEQVAVELNLVMTDPTLLDPDTPAGSEPAWLDDYGPLPAEYARSLVLDAPGSAPRWLRRLYRHPDTSELAALESRRRLFTGAQRRFVRLRDQFCRTSYCGAPIRHTDHIVPSAAGGPTDVTNAQGTCQTCNQTKEAPGWRTRSRPDGAVETTTPTGHHYLSPLPRPPGAGDADQALQRLARVLARFPRAA